MGADYAAIAVIGIRIPMSELCRVASVAKRLCEHPLREGDKYCSVCGKAAFEKTPTFDEQMRDAIVDAGKFQGLPVVFDTDATNAYVGVSVRATQNAKWSAMASLEDRVVISRTYDELRRVLEPLELWDDSQFGLWAAIDCSY